MSNLVPADEDDYEYVEEEVPAAGGRGCLWAIVGMMGCLLIPVFAILLAVLFGLTTLGNAFDGIGDAISSIFEGSPTTATVTTSATVVNSIQPLGQLVSLSVQLAKADITVSVSEGALGSCSRTAKHVAQGTIEAGIDLTQLREEDVSYNSITDTYTIRLPPPQITSCRLDYINQYDRSTSICGPSWENIRLLGTYVALTGFRDDAVEGGILIRAQDEALTTLTNFLQLSTGQSVVVEFRDPDPTTPISYPSSCTPDTPGTWQFNAQSGNWTD